ncbi:MAG: hypothetical protein HPY30_00945 [Gammaproteobacteria bacterium (ex Lamellibrachia satsuma)]|nr:MAG: hypothetical protein HPY30_00945 [Gammaproteobacteria bacterium (ex Lamellibrachia satsuma)]
MSASNQERLSDLIRFYSILEKLSKKTKGPRHLSACSGRMDWPGRGVYFFQEHGEERRDSGSGLRVVRVGTHALKAGSKTTLWKRLSQHKGPVKSGGGNHRGSIFRLIVGTALMERERLVYPTWGKGSSAPREIRQGEHSLEKRVSEVIGDMPFLWLKIDDESGPDTLRGYIERNVIALLSNHNKPAIDSPSGKWLGHLCNREKVRSSGLWNQNHVDEDYDPVFLKVFERLVSEMDER